MPGVFRNESLHGVQKGLGPAHRNSCWGTLPSVSIFGPTAGILLGARVKISPWRAYGEFVARLNTGPRIDDAKAIHDPTSSL